MAQLRTVLEELGLEGEVSPLGRWARIEVTPNGKVVYVQSVNPAEYRAYREGSPYGGIEPPLR